MRQVQIEDIIRIIKEIQPLGEYEEDTLLFEEGYIDSLTIFDKLLPRLEEAYELEMEPTDLLPEHFESPGAIRTFITKKRLTA